MAKQSGLGDNFYISGVDLSGDTNSLGRIGGGPAPWEVQGINRSAHERIGVTRDGEMSWVSYFNPAAGAAHPTLRALPTTDVITSYFRGTSIGSAAASMVGRQINYDPTRGQDGSLTFAVQTLANGYGVDWGVAATAGIRTDTAATNGPLVLDQGVTSTAFGLQAFLHVFAFTGTSVTVTVQDSADNSTFAAVTGGAFAAASAVGAQRIETGRTQTVRRYLRIATTGTFTNAQFAVTLHVNQTATAF